MPNNNQASPLAGSVREAGRYLIDLTGPRSHTLIIQPGVGSLSIGPSQLGKKADLHVALDAFIDWTVFDAFATPAMYHASRPLAIYHLL
ncbi:hypothetical protein H4683_001081 [Filibacter limicola]|uniref:Uncharacterized protein n=1 Tax=Sporosarcina limicola TaxID=34101 RepID=A0A927MMN2_9BACL|nr:hypothetical protein [Sporosarcina limicola]